jgi:predicted enzyme related to lactoylglutathione lyase
MSKRSVVHIEIPAKDTKAAAEFYGQLFGWKITPMPEMDYALWEPDAGPGGGFPKVSDSNPAGQVLVYVESEDIDSDLKKIQSLGGKVIQKKMEIPNTGWFATFKDPVGNTIALFTGTNHQ